MNAFLPPKNKKAMGQGTSMSTACSADASAGLGLDLASGRLLIESTGHEKLQKIYIGRVPGELKHTHTHKHCRSINAEAIKLNSIKFWGFMMN